jgi:hypothetical protein
MYRIICAAIMLVVTTGHTQQARNDGAFLYEQCNVLASAREDLSDVTGLDFGKAMFCAGYLRAIFTTLTRVHEYYKSMMPKYGDWNTKDAKFALGWAANQVLLASDVCFPKGGVRPKTLAMIIAKFAKEHPEQLSSDMFVFAGSAFQDSYPPNKCVP